MLVHVNFPCLQGPFFEPPFCLFIKTYPIFFIIVEQVDRINRVSIVKLENGSGVIIYSSISILELAVMREVTTIMGNKYPNMFEDKGLVGMILDFLGRDIFFKS